MSVKISELPILDSLADNDVIAGVDTSANVTSKIEMATLKNYIDTNTQYTAGTNIDITNNVVSAPNVYNKTETNNLLNVKENISNKVTTLSSSSTNTQYPSAKVVYDELNNLETDLTNDINDLNDEVDNQIQELEEELKSVSTIYNAFPTESGEGESLTLDDTAEVKFKKFDLKGNTSQYTTTGKNLLSIPNMTNTHNGITFDLVDNNIMSFSGTATGTWANLNASNLVDNPMISGQTYTFSIDTTQNVRVVLYETSPQTAHVISEGNKSVTFQASGADNIFIGITNLTTNTNYNGIVKMQLELGNTATDWEEYSGGIASPNPDYPQDIHVVSGDNSIEVCGKNILKYPYLNTTSIVSGVTFTDNGDGSITINGTSTSSTYSLWFLYENAWNYNNLSFELNPGTYTFKGLTTNKVRMACNLYFSDNSNEYFSIAQNDVTKTITNKAKLNMRVLVNGGTTVNNVTIYPQIEVGSSSSSFEPYNGNTYPINLPVENLLEQNRTTTTINGITFRINEDGSVTCNGTASGNALFDIGRNIGKTFPAGTYTASGIPPAGTTSTYRAELYQNVNGTVSNIRSLYGGSSDTPTFTLSETAEVFYRINIISGYNANNLTFKPMIEKGSKATSYTPYGTTPIELCKIGDYQDYFYKGEGYNLLPNNATTQTINGVTFKVNDDKSVTLNGTASAIADFYMYGSSTDTGEYLYIPKGTYSISNPSSGWFYIGREKTLGAVVGNSALLNALSSQDCYFYGFIIRATSGSSLSNLTLYPMINEGSTALPYEPYGSKDKWLLHKEIGKSDLKDEGMVLQSINDYGIANFLVQPIETNVLDTSKIENSLCNRFSRQTTGIAQTQTEGFLRTLNAGIGQLGVYIRISSDKANTVATFKTWLENNPTYYYWALYTPTNTEITYQPLIDQLNELEKAISYENQTNISQVNNDKPFILDVTAIKSLQNILDRIELLES